MAPACLPGRVSSSARVGVSGSAAAPCRARAGAPASSGRALRLRVAACAACRRVSLIPWPLRPAAATPAPLPHAAAGGGASAVSTRLRSLAGPWLAASAASSAPDDAAIDAYLNTLKWDDKGLLVAIAQARAARVRAAARRAAARSAAADSPLPAAMFFGIRMRARLSLLRCRASRTWTRAPS
jgi:hypothetical protein